MDRLDGFRDVLPDNDPRLIAEGDFTPDGGARAMAELLDALPGPGRGVRGLRRDGVRRAADAAHRGLRVPEDVAVVGFDDIVSVAEWTDPPLTTIRQDIEEMGRMMARLLLRRLEPAAEVTAGGQDAGVPALSSIVTPTQLVKRASA